ncbi:MAG: hypothetical protein U9N63_05690 [Pseudomonadota bacterium]|nr:hypothetical protein [Pseudomonadota bacterium]
MKQMVRIVMVLCFCGICNLSGQAEAAPQLVLGELTVAPGQTGVLRISLAGGDEDYAGFNARFFLPDGVDVTAVSEGVLVTGKNFTLGFQEFTENGQNGVTVIAYSGLGAISDANGVIMNVNLSVAMGTADGVFTLGFADNANALLNAKSAFSNADGSQSVSHTTTAGRITIGNSGSGDTDNDGIDDNWELYHFGNLTTANQYTDYDGDGYSDLFEFEYASETDPGGEAIFDPKTVNAPHVACVDTTGGGDCYLSLESLIEAFSENYPAEPVFVKFIQNQRVNADNIVILDQNAHYFFCGGFGNDLNASPAGNSFIDGTVIIRSGTTEFKNIIIGSP